MFEIILDLDSGAKIDMGKMKLSANEIGAEVTDDATFEAAKEKLKKLAVVELKK